MVCQAELRGLGAVNDALIQRGGRVLAVAVDPPAKSRRVVKNNALQFSILSDADRSVIEAYGLVHAGGAPDGGDIAIPAHVLIDRDGRIAWRHVAQRVTLRPRVEDILAAIAALD